jgi:hypothetical protein
MHLGIVKKYFKSERLHEILNDDLDLLCNSLDLDMRAYMFILLVFCVCSNGLGVQNCLGEQFQIVGELICFNVWYHMFGSLPSSKNTISCISFYFPPMEWKYIGNV